MNSPLRVALFVEGSSGTALRRAKVDLLESIWVNLMCNAAAVPAFSHVFGISKKNIVASDSSITRSGVGEEPIADLIARRLREGHGFDAAIVAWDLHPRWNPDSTYCRWQETVDLQRALAASTELPQEWVDAANERLQDFLARPSASSRLKPPRLKVGAILPLCMDSMFESILVSSESALKEALGIAGTTPRGWPRWAETREPDNRLLKPAISAIAAVRPTLPAVRRVQRGWRDGKAEWGEYVLRALLSGPSASLVRSHPIAARLRELY